MSCDADFIRNNTYTNTNNYNWAYHDVQGYRTSNTVAKLQTVADGAMQGMTQTCDGITHGDGNLYSVLSDFMNGYQQAEYHVPGVGEYNDNLVTTCIGNDTSYKTIMALNDQLEGEINELSDDEKTAKLRVDLLRSKDSNITNQQVFLLGRPLRPASIPLLWALSVLFIGIAILIFYMFNPFDLAPSNSMLFKAYLFVRNPMFIGAALLITSASIILGTLYKVGIL